MVSYPDRLIRLVFRSSSDATITLLVQLSLVLLQIQELTYTSLSQARLAKIAVWTVGMQALLDGWMFSSHVMVGILVPSKSSMALIATGFIALLGCAIFTPVRPIVGGKRIQKPDR
jgi:uncharacterized membrane protein YpjA